MKCRNFVENETESQLLHMGGFSTVFFWVKFEECNEYKIAIALRAISVKMQRCTNKAIKLLAGGSLV